MSNSSLATEKKYDLQRIMESAKRLGVEIEEEEALQWLASMASARDDDNITVSTRSGVFGHKISMLDFSDKELDYFKRIGRIVEFDDVDGLVETALALSGSSAQSKIQSYPGDCDYFERVNILASTREDACKVLSKIMMEKALSSLSGPNYQLIEVKYGSYPTEIQGGHTHRLAARPTKGRQDRGIYTGWRCRDGYLGASWLRSGLV